MSDGQQRRNRGRYQRHPGLWYPDVRACICAAAGVLLMTVAVGETTNRYLKTCPRCETEFYASHLHRKYCGERCARKTHQRRRKVREKENGYTFKHHNICKYCGKEFRARRKSVKYCSPECRKLRSQEVWSSCSLSGCVFYRTCKHNVIAVSDITWQPYCFATSKYNGLFVQQYGEVEK